MDEKTSALDALPYPLLLEIAFYLDIDSLIALSEVNRALRTLSRSFKTFWIPSVLRAKLSLPLSSHCPLSSFSASELHLAVHRASFRERNLCSPKPRLYSHTLIQWPFASPRTIIEESNNSIPTVPSLETPDDALWRHLASPNGEWLFIVARDALVRVVHLRTGKVWEKRYAEIVVPFNRHETRVRFAIDFRGDVDAVMVLAINEIGNAEYYNEDEAGESFTPGQPLQGVVLRILRVTFDIETPSVSFKEVAKYNRERMPISLDIAGDYVLYSTGLSQQHHHTSGLGIVSLFRWVDGTLIALPELRPSIVSLIFRGYFFSIGVVEPTSIYLEVVSLPWRDGDKFDKETCNEKVATSEETKDSFSLVASIRLPPKSRENDIRLMPESVDVPHVYMGKVPSTIVVWVRASRPNNSWNIFTLEADFSKPPRQWFEKYLDISSESTEDDCDTDSSSIIQHRRVWDRHHLIHWPASAPPGRRFIWPTYDPTTTREREEEDMLSDASDNPLIKRRPRRDKVRLWASLIDYLPVMRNTGDLPDDYIVDMEEQSERIPAHELEVPEGYEFDRQKESIFTTDLEERCGTVTSIMSNGNIWVMRYGHS